VACFLDLFLSNKNGAYSREEYLFCNLANEMLSVVIFVDDAGSSQVGFR
jgi:hypothetical protein